MLKSGRRRSGGRLGARVVRPVPPLGVVALPWLAPTPRQLAAVVADPRVTSMLAEVSQRRHRLVALAPLGHRELAARSPVRAPADLAGLRVRAPTTPIVQQSYWAPAPGGRVVVRRCAGGIAIGTLDAQDGPATALFAARVGATAAARHAMGSLRRCDRVRRAQRCMERGRRRCVRRRAIRPCAAREAMAAAREDSAMAELARTGRDHAVDAGRPRGVPQHRARYLRPLDTGIGCATGRGAQAAARAAHRDRTGRLGHHIDAPRGAVLITGSHGGAIAAWYARRPACARPFQRCRGGLDMPASWVSRCSSAYAWRHGGPPPAHACDAGTHTMPA